MAVKIVAKYQKAGAEFATAADAYADRNAEMDATTIQSIDDANTALLNQGIMLSPPVHIWDSNTCILRIEKTVTSEQDYFNNLSVNLVKVLTEARINGWVSLGVEIVPV